MTRASDLITRVNSISALAPTCIPDHSMLSWIIVCDSVLSEYNDESTFSRSVDKFDVSAVPDTFLSSEETLSQVNTIIDKLEHSKRSQDDIDGIFSEWCGIVQNNMTLYAIVYHIGQ